VRKFADGLPLYRIAGRLPRLGIERSHALMSEWLEPCAELLDELHRRMVLKVLDSGHVHAEDTTLPLQNHDYTRGKSHEAKLRVYAKGDRHGPPLIIDEFTKSPARKSAFTRRRLELLGDGIPRALCSVSYSNGSYRKLEPAPKVASSRIGSRADPILRLLGAANSGLGAFCLLHIHSPGASHGRWKPLIQCTEFRITP
jgi:hypothetical protein